MSKIIAYQWNEIHASVFSSFVDAMNKTQIKFFVLRNYEGLPNNNTSKDVDIVIEPGYYTQSKKLLLQSLKEGGFDHYYIMTYERAHCVYGMDSVNLNSIHIDLIEGYANKGYEILSFEELYDNTLLYKGFRVLKPSYDAIMLLLYKIVGVKELKQKYRDEITSNYSTNKDEIAMVLQRVLGAKCAGKVIADLDCGNYNNIVENALLIGKSAKNIAFKRNVIRTIKGIYKFYSEKFYNIIWCPRHMQKLIIVEAPDGTGKTTFIDNLVISIAQAYVSELSKTRVYHFRPGYFLNLGAVGEKSGMMKQDTNFTQPHRAKPAGIISSFIRMTYYWIDYVIGMPLILRKNAQFDKITIFDRYIYDFLVDPRRSRINLPYWLRKCFTKLVKQPKIVFVLDAPVDVIYKRKQELTPDEISRQLMDFQKLSSLGKRYYCLDASKKPEEIANDAIKIILDKFTNKL